MNGKLALLLLCFPQFMLGQRNEFVMNKDWHFISSDIIGASHPECDISSWKK